MSMVVTLAPEGTITIPADVRERLQLRPGDTIELHEQALKPLPRELPSAEDRDRALEEWRRSAAELLRGHPWEKMSVAEILDETRGEVDDVTNPP